METNLIVNDIFRNFTKNLTVEDIAMLSPLQLAYIGDGVYELFIRTYMLNKKLSVRVLHKLSTEYVKASSQANIIHKLDHILTDKEKQVVKSGRNAKSGTMAKNASVIDYKYATGFEALIGYLFLHKEDVRLGQIFSEIIDLDF